VWAFIEKEFVFDFMQRGSHHTRAYIINSNMLKGFLVEYETDIVHKKLLEFSSTARYGRIAKHQHIDIKKI